MTVEIAASHLAIQIDTTVSAYLADDRLSPIDAIAVLVEAVRHLGDTYDCIDDGKEVVVLALRSDWTKEYRHLEPVGGGGAMSQRNIDDDEMLDGLYDKLDRYEAVIEAAKAANDDIRYLIGQDGDTGPGVMRCMVVVEAVDALERAEKEE